MAVGSNAPRRIGRAAAQRKKAAQLQMRYVKAGGAMVVALLAVGTAWFSHRGASGQGEHGTSVVADIPRENRCEACKFVVDSALLAIEKDIYQQKGDTSWGDLNLRLNTPKLLSPAELCVHAVFKQMFDQYVTSADLRAEPRTTIAQTLAACRYVAHVRAHELNMIFTDADYRPMMMVAEKLPDKKIPKGNLRQRSERSYPSVCLTHMLCNETEVAPLYSKLPEEAHAAASLDSTS